MGCKLILNKKSHRKSSLQKGRFRRRFLSYFFILFLSFVIIFVLHNQVYSQDAFEASSTPFSWQVYILTFALLLSSAFFSATETAFFSIRSNRLKEMVDSTSITDRIVAQLMLRPAELLTTILIGNAIVNISLTIVFGTRLERFLSERVFANTFGSNWISYVLTVFISSTILIFGGEVTPKLFSSRFVESYARSVAPIVFIIHQTLSPMRKLILNIIGLIFRLTRFSSIPPSPWVTGDELKSLVQKSELSDVIAEEERKMIRGILEFRDESVKRILVPRTDIIAIPDTATVADAWEIFCEHEYSRMPIFHENLDHIVGILYAKDLLDWTEEERWNQPVKPLGRKVHFIPEAMAISEFIKMTQRVHAHMAIVVDEYGGTAGLVTLHDALSIIVGEIGDDEKEEEPLFVKIDEGEYLINGKMPIAELEELIQISLEDKEHTTVAGFLLSQHESLLDVGNSVEIGSVRFIIDRMEGNRIAWVRLQVKGKEVEENEVNGGRGD